MLPSAAAVGVTARLSKEIVALMSAVALSGMNNISGQ